MRTYALVCGLVAIAVAVAAPVRAGSIDPGLAQILASTPAGEPVSVLVFLREQVNLAALTAVLDAERATLAVRHETVVRALQAQAESTQGPLRDHLRELVSAGRLGPFEAFWIANLFRVSAPAAEIELLAGHPDVGTIYYNYGIELIAPMQAGPGASPELPIENGVVAVRAPEAWALGYTGAGVLVANMDTGVDGNHPALASRWAGVADPRYAGHPEWAWLDPYTYQNNFPFDSNGHGTHTMGTVCGGAPGDQVGVAPGALWIASAPIDRFSIAQTVADAIESFQWMVDPDGNPNTNWDVPAVCSNSWGLVTSHGYPPCDQTFWSYLDACEAAGTVILFSAGNEGSQGLRRPADRATDEYRTLSVGAVDAHTPGWPIAWFSSLGPSNCTPTGVAAIKPEIVAPGYHVRSAWLGGGYYELDGTSMASPHVNGVVALIREACPDLSVEEVKQILYETAHDLGPAGNDNTFGWGMVDALEAVLQAESMCGPHPPKAYDGYYETQMNTPVMCELKAVDHDGGPLPMVYIITALPTYELRDAGNNHLIVASELPYTLVNNGKHVLYHPVGVFVGMDSFKFKANDGGTPPTGGDSNIATVTVKVGGPRQLYSFPLNTNPGWSVQGQWAFGDPTGQGGQSYGYPDPNNGATGTNVYGVNLNGDYSINIGGPYYLTMGPLNFQDCTDVSLRFQRWLNTDYQPYVYATIQVSKDGSTWTDVWSNGTNEIAENAWAQRQYSIANVANNQPAVYVRWGHQVDSFGAWAYSGWNIDDVEFWGVTPLTLGDLNCDGVLNAFDIDPFVLALTNANGYAAAYPNCVRALADCNLDGVIDAFDIDPFVDLLVP